MPASQHLQSIRNGYNSISGTYDRRYKINPLKGVEKALRDLVRKSRAQRVLEIGCGTGYWLKTLLPYVDRMIGLDLSSGMLRQALPIPAAISLVCGSANSLPFVEGVFDLVFVVNALHHFEEKRDFVKGAPYLLNVNGALAIIGLDIPSAIGHSVMYDYFPGALEYDQSRFAPWEHVESWMREAGLAVQPLSTVEHVRYEKRGRAILDDHFIQRYGTSQFMGLTEAQYQAGIDRIKVEIVRAEERGEEAEFKTEFQLKMLVGYVTLRLPLPVQANSASPSP